MSGPMTGGPTVVWSVTVPPDLASVGLARRSLRSALGERGLHDFVDAASLAASELVTNAVLHARTPVEVRLFETTDGIRVEVADGSAQRPALRTYGAWATTGRGLSLVLSLVAQLGVQPTANGKAVWFSLTRSALGSVARGAQVAWETAREAEGPTHPAELVPPATAVLLDIPVALWLAAQRHHDAAVRELVLHRAAHGPAEGARAPSLADADDAKSVLDAAFDQALGEALGDSGTLHVPGWALSPGRRMPATLRVEVLLTAGLVDGLATLQDLLDEADRLAAADLLLVRPALPEIVALRDWCCEQVIAQSAGAAPTAWVGDERDVRVRAGRSRPLVPLPGWDPTEVATSDRCLVAGDDHNRLVAVSEPAARLLGWQVADLIGRRVVTLVPERLREAHIASFTRYQATGEGHVVGQALELPVLRADGTEVVCGFLLQQVPAQAGRTVYVVSLTPPDAPPEPSAPGTEPVTRS